MSQSLRNRAVFNYLGEPYSHLELYHKWPSTQYSAYNALNVNNDGNVNNNNKYNELTAVPFSEVSNKDKVQTGYQVPLSHLRDAYRECIKHKRWTLNAMLFSVDRERKLKLLQKEINDRTYEIGKSVVFIVERPVKREVFAASFRDRIVHDWICMRLVPLFEAYLPDCMTSNRKNKGNLYAIEKVEELIREKSVNYTRDCWIWKFDLQGCFMSIDKRLLNKKLQEFIDERYFGKDKDILKWLTEKVVMNCPQLNCIRKSPLRAWIGLSSNKSLFTQDKFHGMPIGNLPSQLFVNFLLCLMVIYLKERGVACVQYVDDVTAVHESKEEILRLIPDFRKWLQEELHITLHPHKCYIQHYTKGVSFVGGIIKPHIKYLSKRTVRRALAKVHWIVKGGLDIEKAREEANSYLGLSRHFAAYKLRKKIAEMLFTRFHSQICFDINFNRLILK